MGLGHEVLLASVAGGLTQGWRGSGISSRARKQTTTITLRPTGAPSPRSMVVVNTVGSNAAAVGSTPYRFTRRGRMPAAGILGWKMSKY